MADNEDNYDVGYGKPPRDSRFQKGTSGNPKGRPKGSESFQSLCLKSARQPARITENGRPRILTNLEIVLLQLSNKAKAGDLRATKDYLQLVRHCELSEAEGAAERPDREKNAEVFRSLVKRIRSLDTAQSSTDETNEENGE